MFYVERLAYNIDFISVKLMKEKSNKRGNVILKDNIYTFFLNFN